MTTVIYKLDTKRIRRIDYITILYKTTLLGLGFVLKVETVVFLAETFLFGLVLFKKRIAGTAHGVPKCKEGLGKVCLDAKVLVVDVVVGSIVGKEFLKGVVGELVAAVVVDGFEGAECVKDDTFAG